MPRDPYLVALGVAVRALREERGFSQEDVSLRSGVHRNYVGGVERGERRPTVKVIARIAAALGVETSEVFKRMERGGATTKGM